MSKRLDELQEIVGQYWGDYQIDMLHDSLPALIAIARAAEAYMDSFDNPDGIPSGELMDELDFALAAFEEDEE